MVEHQGLIICSPYDEPKIHLSYHPGTRKFKTVESRRPAGYVIATEASRTFDDPGRFIEIELVNKIRGRVKKWREADYLGVTGVTKALLHHWFPNENKDEPDNIEEKRLPFFFCQREAIETIIWLVEAPNADKTGIDIPSDGGSFPRICSKMATGSGKTIVMAMLIAWQILNKVNSTQDKRFSKNIFVIAPGLTVKTRLQVLYPSSVNNYYDQFDIVPPDMMDRFRQGKVLVTNWHVLNWDTEEKLAKKHNVDKRGVISDEAYVRDVLGDLANSENIVVINDEAHHAWRVSEEFQVQVKGLDKDDVDEATIWISGLDRIHNARGILTCYDFSATPFVPLGKQSSEETLFKWIVSDFGLNDAIESGLVKTPRVVVRDDSKLSPEMKSRFYHLYNDLTVKEDLNRKAEDWEALPELVINAYYHLGFDWRETKRAWAEQGHPVPPVMISVVNRTETAARVKFSFDHKKIFIKELCDPDRTLHIDSKVIKDAESADEAKHILEDPDKDEADESAPVPKLNRKDFGERLRQKVDTVGKIGEPGEQYQNIISVGMLSEGWDAKTVTHIMGLRAFTSQLLCEQVVGRGLRRTSYEVNKQGLFDPEYVNIFGIPFTFLPHESTDGPAPPPQVAKTEIKPVNEKQHFAISWPNVLRIEHTYTPTLSLDINYIKSLTLNAYNTALTSELAQILEGKPDLTKLTQIELEKLGQEMRYQRIVFETAREVYDTMEHTWKGNREFLLVQLIGLVEKVIRSGKIKFFPPEFNEDDIRRRVLITLNLRKVVDHIWKAIRFENTEAVVPVFDPDRPIRSTRDMFPWYTGRPSVPAMKSHINNCVCDSKWEGSEAFELDRNENVDAWVKNDHLMFEVLYMFEGAVRKYRPDFVIRLTNGTNFILETKGMDTGRDRTKREFLDEWIKAINGHGGFGKWDWAVSKNPADLKKIIDRAIRAGQ